jgi:hypothetical protein
LDRLSIITAFMLCKVQYSTKQRPIQGLF